MEQTQQKPAVHLPIYDGPLELLLALIAKNEIDIYDIPIKLITDQYMDYIYELNSFNIELATEFVVMAAQLIEIKSKMMLPPEESDEEEGTDPRDELVARLIEYGIFKHISEYFAVSEQSYGKLITKDPEFYEDLFTKDENNLSLTPEMLVRAMNNVILKRRLRLVRESGYVVEQESYSVDRVMNELRERLERSGKLCFSQLISEHHSKAYVVAVFMAILEMYKINAIGLRQRNNFEDIEIEKGSGENFGRSDEPESEDDY